MTPPSPDLAPAPRTRAGAALATIAANVPRALSALVPGLGQLATGRFVEATFFLFATLYLRLFVTGFALPEDRLTTFVFGAPGMTGGLRKPIMVVFTLVLVGVHVFAAWTARRSTHAKEKGSGEARDLAL